MPIKVQCKCGKSLAVPDAAAGKSVRCPGCQAAIKVPAGNSAPSGTGGQASPAKSAPQKPAASKPAPQKPSPPAGGAGKPQGSAPASSKPAAGGPSRSAPVSAAFGGSDDLSDLFDQEGFKVQTGPTCPACHHALKPNAVMCTSCGLHFQTGERVAGMAVAPHGSAPAKSGGGHGHGSGDAKEALAHAEAMMERDQRLQEKLVRGGGLPWWVLLIILMLLVGGGLVFSVTMIALFAKDPEKLGSMGRVAGMNKMLLFGIVMIAAFGLVGNIGAWVILITAFKESAQRALMVLFIPFYMFIYCFKEWKKLSGAFWMMLISTLGSILATVFIIIGLVASS